MHTIHTSARNSFVPRERVLGQVRLILRRLSLVVWVLVSLLMAMPGGIALARASEQTHPLRSMLTASAATIAAGGSHTCALTAAGGIKCWGQNYSGQLGDGSSLNRLEPVDVSGLTSGVSAVVTGYEYSCALTTAGGVKCWGHNTYGQLGRSILTSTQLLPEDVSGLGNGVSAIAAGGEHMCAVMTAGGVKCWGQNEHGQLGDGSQINRYTPVDVGGLSGNVSAITAGSEHTCALLTAGSVQCWGGNYSGQLGDGSQLNRLAPVNVGGLTSGVIAIAAGSSHTCALITGGGVQCWGSNYAAQLGDNTQTDRFTPVNVGGLTAAITAIAAGGIHTCALTEAGHVQCWGNNYFGQLGDGTQTDRALAVTVSGLRDVSAITAGANHTCALISVVGIRCWGWNQFGQLGDGTSMNRLTPEQVSGLTSGMTAIVAGGAHTRGLTMGGGVQCWGGNGLGQLGDGTYMSRPTPVNVPVLGSGVIALTAGNTHTCALTAAGGVKCWGDNEGGQLGGSSSAGMSALVDVVGLSSGVSAITAGLFHTCALLSSGGVKCWGNNYYGQLGDGRVSNGLVPVDVSGLSSGVIAIDAGAVYTCAVLSSGAVKCWGDSAEGQLGAGIPVNPFTPVDISGLSSGVSAIAAGDRHTCAVLSSGVVQCWGSNDSGQLGNGTLLSRSTPTAVSGLTGGVSAITAGGRQTCALMTNGGVRCWGGNVSGQVGDGSQIDRLTPVDVSGLSRNVSAIAAGSNHTCALTLNGNVKCWGNNYSGQVGISPSWTPVQVFGSADFMQLWSHYNFMPVAALHGS